MSAALVVNAEPSMEQLIEQIAKAAYEVYLATIDKEGDTLMSCQVRYEFSTAELKQGAYHYAVSNGADVIGTGKLMILR